MFKIKNVLLTFTMFFVFSYGVAVGVYKIFPFELIQSVKSQLSINKHGINANTAHRERLGQFRRFPAKAENVMVGDSITHYGLWSDIFPQYSVLNRGIDSDKTTDILDRIDTILSASPKRVFLMMGVNDFNIGKRKVNDVFATYKKIINQLISHNIDVVIQSTIECANCSSTTLKVRELNIILKEYAEKNNLVYLDLNESLSDLNGLKKIYQNDGVHPNAEGYAVWSLAIEPFLLK